MALLLEESHHRLTIQQIRHILVYIFFLFLSFLSLIQKLK